jgi:hypothetical protein
MTAGHLASVLLARLGMAALCAPVGATILGLAVPGLAEFGRSLLPLCIVLLLGTSVVLVEPGPLRGHELLPPLALVTCNLLFAAVLACTPAPLAGLEASWPWFVLVAAAPPAGSAALIAATLGLAVRPLLFAQMVGFLALPLTAPVLATLLLPGLTIDTGILVLRVALLVGLPCLGGIAVRRWLGSGRRRSLAPQIRSIGTIALIGIGLGTAAGLAAPASLARVPDVLFGLSLVLLLGAGIGAAVGLLGTPDGAAGLALAGGIRNMTLLWGACIEAVPPEGALVLQLGTLATLTLPMLLALLRRCAPARGHRAIKAAALAKADAAIQVMLRPDPFPDPPLPARLPATFHPLKRPGLTR